MMVFEILKFLEGISERRSMTENVLNEAAVQILDREFASHQLLKEAPFIEPMKHEPYKGFCTSQTSS
jgi:hypothetical protein